MYVHSIRVFFTEFGIEFDRANKKVTNQVLKVKKIYKSTPFDDDAATAIESSNVWNWFHSMKNGHKNDWYIL